ncbi:MAG: hypothetical protein R6V25_05790 [Desulfatiglandales bacterium]
MKVEQGPARRGIRKFSLDRGVFFGAGEPESGLGPGSACLALDRNGNGVIDDGSELFGPSRESN